MSPSSRRAWVEIILIIERLSINRVALLAEGVGRNGGGGDTNENICVALLAEGVGRNGLRVKCRTLSGVALLAEGVGRNIAASTPIENRTGSPSSRRAWVEMDRRGRNVPPHKSPSSRRAWVEIRRKSWKAPIPTSPSSRRAWVEIIRIPHHPAQYRVALLAEGVGRNVPSVGAPTLVIRVALLAEGVGRNPPSSAHTM